MGYSIKNGYVYDETSDCEGNEITNVLVSVGEDRENVLGVGRITYIDIEVENEDEEAVRCMQADIQHAIARNYLKNANDEKDVSIAKSLFSEGEKKFIDLIDSKENYKEKARFFSIHCYVHEKVKFLKKHPELINKEECRTMKRYIDRISRLEDDYVKELVKEYVMLLKEYGYMEVITMRHGDIYFDALGSSNTKIQDYFEEDALIESY